MVSSVPNQHVPYMCTASWSASRKSNEYYNMDTLKVYITQKPIHTYSDAINHSMDDYKLRLKIFKASARGTRGTAENIQNR